MSIDWIYGTWQINLSISIPSNIFPEIAAEYNDNYTLNICVWNSRTFYLKILTGKHGVLGWFGPYTISKSITDIPPDRNGIITVDPSLVTPPTLPPGISWPIDNISQHDLVSYPLIINTNNPNTDQNGTRVGIVLVMGSIFNQTFYGTKGCQNADKLNPYIDCFPVNDLAGKPYPMIDLPKIPALCPIRGTPPSCDINIPSSIKTIIYIVGVVIILSIIAIIVLSILLIRKPKCSTLTPFK